MGYLYLAEFKDKPGVFKIGKTKNDNNSRFWQLSRHHGELVHLRRWDCQDRYSQAERACHATLASQRVTVEGDGGTEFFNGFTGFAEASDKLDELVKSFLAETRPSVAVGSTPDLNKVTYDYVLNDSRGIWDEKLRESFRKIPMDVVVAVQKIAFTARQRNIAAESITRKYNAVKTKYFSPFGSDALRMVVYVADDEGLAYIVEKFAKHHPEIPEKAVKFHYNNRKASDRLSQLAYSIDRAGEAMLQPYFSNNEEYERAAWRLYSVIKEYVSRRKKGYL